MFTVNDVCISFPWNWLLKNNINCIKIKNVEKEVKEVEKETWFTCNLTFTLHSIDGGFFPLFSVSHSFLHSLVFASIFPCLYLFFLHLACLRHTILPLIFLTTHPFTFPAPSRTIARGYNSHSWFEFPIFKPFSLLLAAVTENAVCLFICICICIYPKLKDY